MRTYSTNSPEAAARILALAVLSDGHPAQIELDTLDHLLAVQQLGMSAEAFHVVIQELCEDLLVSSHKTWDVSSRIDTRVAAPLLAEIDEPALQLKLFHLCLAAIQADRVLLDGEVSFMRRAVQQWGIERHERFQGEMGSVSA